MEATRASWRHLQDSAEAPGAVEATGSFYKRKGPILETPGAVAATLLVGVDMGITDRMTLSTGETVPRRALDRGHIEEAQRRRSRCRKRSREWRRRSMVLRNLHAREKVRNRNEVHRITTELVGRFAVIVVEDLNIRNMTRSAAGTVDEPGTNVAAKSGLNRSITEQTWGLFRNQLAYKVEWAGKRLIAVDPRRTSETCSRCGAVDAASRDGKVYSCASCGVTMDADHNAALNILDRGLALISA